MERESERGKIHGRENIKKRKYGSIGKDKKIWKGKI